MKNYTCHLQIDLMVVNMDFLDGLFLEEMHYKDQHLLEIYKHGKHCMPLEDFQEYLIGYFVLFVLTI